MDLLLEFIPEKDLVIALQKKQIISQIDELHQEMKKNELSEQQREQLLQKMNHLKRQLIELKNLSDTDSHTQAAIMYQPDQVLMASQEKDTLLESKEREIAELKNIIMNLQNQKPDVIVHHKLSVYYLTAVSQDKRNRASRTNYVNIQFQLKGDISLMKEKYLHIEIRDPSHRIISTEKDKVRMNNQFITSYRFEPVRYKFIKGKYSIRVYSTDSDFQSVTFFTLI
jgi:anion-transporting  ArsA/GET3 family ATPase